MTVTVWKFHLATAGYNLASIQMPAGARPLHVGVDPAAPSYGYAGAADVLGLWALVDPDAPVVHRWFAVTGTGHPLPTPDATHVGTVVTAVGLVWHVWDAGEETPEAGP